VHRSEVYSLREAILGVSLMSSWFNFHEVLELNPMRLGLIFMRLGLISMKKNNEHVHCMSMYSMVLMSVMFLYHE